MFSAFIYEWSPDILGTTWALRTVDGQWSVCMVTPRAPEEEQTARCTGWGGAFIHYFSPSANIYVDPTSSVSRGMQTWIRNPKERLGGHEKV